MALLQYFVCFWICCWVFCWWRRRPHKSDQVIVPNTTDELKHALCGNVPDEKIINLFNHYQYSDIASVRAMLTLIIEHRPFLLPKLQVMDPVQTIW